MKDRETLKKEVREIINTSRGTRRYYDDPSGIKLTEGINAIREIAKADWLINDIGIASKIGIKHPPHFQVWILTVSKEHTASITCKEDINSPILYSQNYSFTTFPDGKWEFWIIDGVMLLPSEY